MQGNIKSFSSGFAANEDSLKISHDQIVEIINPAKGAKRIYRVPKLVILMKLVFFS